MGTLKQKTFKAISVACVFLITTYQYTLSPLFKLLGVNCRFHPSCSEYAKRSFQEHTFFKAFYLSAKRLLSCNPYFKN